MKRPKSSLSSQTPGSPPGEKFPGYEIRDAQVSTIAIAGGVIALGVVFSLFFAGFIYRARFADRVSVGPRQTAFSESPAFRSSIAREWVPLDHEMQSKLQSYGWVDRPQGIVRIPIDRAMELLIAEATPTGASATPEKPKP